MNSSDIIKIAKKYKLKIIEDSCESINATYKNKRAGTFGESAIFSFYPNKQITTAEGGMLVTDSKRIYDLCCSLRNQGRSANMQWRDHNQLGYNYRMNEISAAIGIAQLEKINFIISQRQKIASLYTKYLSKYPELIEIPRIGKNNNHTWFVYVAQLKNKTLNRDKVIMNLARDGISSKPYLPSIHTFNFYKKRFKYKNGDFPISESVSNSSIALPFYIGLKEKDIKYIVDKLIKLIKTAK